MERGDDLFSFEYHGQITYKTGFTHQGLERLVATIMRGPGKIKSLDDLEIADGAIAEQVLCSIKTQ